MRFNLRGAKGVFIVSLCGAQEMQDALDKKRRDIEARDRWCKEKEDELQRRKEEMRAREAKFNQFVKENEAKRNHAIKKRKEELEETKKKEAEIERHKQELDEFSRLRDQRRAHLDHMSKYSNFIDAVVEYGDRFHDVSELLSRYETLKQSNKDLRERIDKTNTELENTRSELYRYTKEKDNEFLFLTSQIAANQKQLDHIKSEIQEYEERWQAQREVENEEMRKAGRAKMAIDNLYKRARETTHLVKSKFEHQSLFEKLDYIETRMHDLKEIVHAARNNNLDALLPPGRR